MHKMSVKLAESGDQAVTGGTWQKSTSKLKCFDMAFQRMSDVEVL